MRRAYTLIEIILTVAIAGILSMGMFKALEAIALRSERPKRSAPSRSIRKAPSTRSVRSSTTASPSPPSDSILTTPAPTVRWMK